MDFDVFLAHNRRDKPAVPELSVCWRVIHRWGAERISRRSLLDGVCRKKHFSVQNSVMLCVSVVKILEKIHHRGTEVTQRTTEINFPTDSLTRTCSNYVLCKAAGSIPCR